MKAKIPAVIFLSVLIIILFITSAYPAAASDRGDVVMLFAGDLLLHRYVQMSGKAPGGGYDYSAIFSDVAPTVRSADIAVINQETLLAGEKFGLSGYPCFNAPCEVADAVVGAGFDVVLTATNHALDKGFEGLCACRSYWQEKFPQIMLPGTAANAGEAEKITCVECRGIKIAILNYTYGTNGIPLPPGKEFCVNILSPEKVAEDIRHSTEIADFCVVCPHWGDEYKREPSAKQRSLCKLFLEAGADLVVGTHSHVPGRVEELVRSDGHRMTVFYSLGNFVNSSAEYGRGICDRMLGGLAAVTLKRNGGRVTVGSARFIPIVTQLSPGFGGVRTYLFEHYTPALAKENSRVINHDSSFSYDYCKKFFAQYTK